MGMGCQDAPPEPKTYPHLGMKNTCGILLALMASASFASAATTLINVDFNVTNFTGGNTPSPDTYTGGNVLGTTGDSWNAVTVARNNSVGDTTSVPITTLNYSDGSASGVSLAVTTFNNSIITDKGANIATNQQPLMNDYIYLNGTQSSTITLSGFAANQEISSLVFYAQAINSFSTTSGSTFTIGSDIRSTSESATSIGATLIENTDYVMFSNLTANGSGTLQIIWSNSSGQGAFNGMQIQLVPEPSTALLGGLGLLCLLRRRRR